MGKGKALKKRSALGSKVLDGLHRFLFMWPAELTCSANCPSGTCFHAGTGAADGPGRYPDLEFLVYKRAWHCIKGHFNMFSTSYKRVAVDSPSTMVTYHERRIEQRRPAIEEDFIFHSECFMRA